MSLFLEVMNGGNNTPLEILRSCLASHSLAAGVEILGKEWSASVLWLLGIQRAQDLWANEGSFYSKKEPHFAEIRQVTDRARRDVMMAPPLDFSSGRMILACDRSHLRSLLSFFFLHQTRLYKALK